MQGTTLGVEEEGVAPVAEFRERRGPGGFDGVWVIPDT